MRLLTEYMSVPEVNGAVVPKASVTEKQAVTVSGEGDSIENRNLQLARQVEEHKNELVKALSRLPMTALWLLSKYEQIRNKDEQEDEAVIPSELNDFLKDIKRHFNAANRDFYAASQNLENRSNAKKRLMNAVQELPFAFEDLVKLVDIVIYAFKFRGISFDGHFCSDQTSKYPATKKHFDIIEQRLEKVSRTARTRLEGQFQAMDLQAYEEMFLFLPIKEMIEIIPNLILAEHYWLSNRQQLATVNSKLVLFIANQYKGNFLDFEDLVQEGHTGLLKAVDRFKYRLGFQFSTYAGYWIRQAISRALSRSERVVRIPCGQIATINKLFRAKDELTLKTGIEPSIQELAEFTNLSQDEVNNILSISQSAVTLEGFEDDDDDQAFAPIDYLQQKVFTQSYSLIAESQLQALVKNAVKTLNAREAKILCSHFGLGTDEQMTLQEIGSELNLTRERVRQIQVVALNKIKMRHGEQLVSFL